MSLVGQAGPARSEKSLDEALGDGSQGCQAKCEAKVCTWTSGP